MTTKVDETKIYQGVIKRIDNLLDGGEFEGIKIGDPGITSEWLNETRIMYQRLLAGCMLDN